MALASYNIEIDAENIIVLHYRVPEIAKASRLIG